MIPGQRIICVDADQVQDQLKNGKIYIVKSSVFCDTCDMEYIEIEGGSRDALFITRCDRCGDTVVRDSKRRYYSVNRFKTLNEVDIETIGSIKIDAKDIDVILDDILQLGIENVSKSALDLLTIYAKQQQ